MEPDEYSPLVSLRSYITGDLDGHIIGIIVDDRHDIADAAEGLRQLTPPCYVCVDDFADFGGPSP